MLHPVDEEISQKISLELQEFINSNYPPRCTQLFFKIFYQAYSDPHFSLTDDEKMAMEKISDLLMMLWEAKGKTDD